MGWPSSPEYNTSFYQMSRHAEIVVTRDKDCFAFFPDMIPLAATSGMGIYRDSAKTITQWLSVSPPTAAASERVLLWSRVSGTGLVSAFRWVPYVNSDDIDNPDIKPLREVYAPRVAYDRESNTIHLWFWTNVNWAYNLSVYDEAQIYQIGAKDYDQAIGTGIKKCKKVLCYAVGHFEHLYVEGGWVGGFVGQPGSTAQYDMIPIFSRPEIITNYTPTPDDAANGPGLITDGWYPATDKFPFQLIRKTYNQIGMRCGWRIRNGQFCETSAGADTMPATPSHDLNTLWWHTFSTTTSWLYVRLRFEALVSSWNSPGVVPLPVMFPTLESGDPTTWTYPVGGGSVDAYHRDLCVGRVMYDDTTKTLTYEQWWHGGHEDDTAVVPDTNSVATKYDSTVYGSDINDTQNPTRSTIENYTPGGGSHQKELQLYGVDTVPQDVDAFPYFETLLTDSISSQRRGTLNWSILDSKNTITLADYSSLGLYTDILGSGKQVLEIYGFHLTSTKGHSAPFKDRTATPAAIEWRYPVKGNAATNASAAPLSASVDCMDTITAITVTHDNGAGTAIPSYPVGTWFNCGTVNLAITSSKGKVTANGDGTGNVYDPTTVTEDASFTFDMWLKAVPDHKHKHTTLDFTSGTAGTGGQNTDHDWRYWIQGDSMTSCYGTTIGYGTGPYSSSVLRIDLGPCQLTNGISIRVDWGLGLLKDSSAAIVAKWFTGELTLAGSTTTLNWLTQKQYDVAGGESIDWNARVLTGAAAGTLPYWQVAASTIFIINNTTDGGDFTGSAGALQVKGGASIAKKLYVGTEINVTNAYNYWRPASDFAAEVSGFIHLRSGGDTVIQPSVATSYVHIYAHGTSDELSLGGFTLFGKADAITFTSGGAPSSGTLNGTGWTASPTTFNMNPTNMQYASFAALDTGVHVVLNVSGGGTVDAYVRKGGLCTS